jgi:hypothetical protein
MAKEKRNQWFKRIGITTAAALGLLAVALPLAPAKANMVYLGWDFGNGFGVGVGPVPSAYGYHYCPWSFTATNRPCY